MIENPNNPINPAEELAQTRSTRGLSRLAGFSERQLEHINSWLDEGVAYRKIAEFCRTEFQHEVPHMTIARYAKRSVARTLIADLTDSKEAAAEISQYAATGDASFSTNTVELLEQKAFDLAAVYQRDCDAADLKTLTQLTSIINKARNTKVRERHATVQEQKLELRREELALKREIHQARLASKNNGGTSSTSTSRDDITPTVAASSFENHGRGAERVSAQANISSDVFHPRPTSTSRDAIDSTHAASADPNASLSQQGTTIREANVSHGATNSWRAREATGLGEGFSHTPANSSRTNTGSSEESVAKDSSNDRFPTPNPLPYEIYLKNCAYTEKLLAGLVDPDTGEELPDPNESPDSLFSPLPPVQNPNGGAL